MRNLPGCRKIPKFSETPANFSSPGWPQERGGRAKLTILLVIDDPSMQNYLTRLLAALSVETLYFARGTASAMQVAENNKISLAIILAGTGGMNDLTLALWLRGVYPGLPVMVLGDVVAEDQASLHEADIPLLQGAAEIQALPRELAKIGIPLNPQRGTLPMKVVQIQLARDKLDVEPMVNVPISPHLWLGNFRAAENAAALGFDAALGVLDYPILPRDAVQALQHFEQIPVPDHWISDHTIRLALGWLERRIQDGLETLVFCRFAYSRSVAVAVAYLYATFAEMSFEQAFGVVREARQGGIRSSPEFKATLKIQLERIFPPEIRFRRQAMSSSA